MSRYGEVIAHGHMIAAVDMIAVWTTTRFFISFNKVDRFLVTGTRGRPHMSKWTSVAAASLLGAIVCSTLSVLEAQQNAWPEIDLTNLADYFFCRTATMGSRTTDTSLQAKSEDRLCISTILVQTGLIRNLLRFPLKTNTGVGLATLKLVEYGGPKRRDQFRQQFPATRLESGLYSSSAGVYPNRRQSGCRPPIFLPTSRE